MVHTAHPLRKAMGVLRSWLVMLSMMMALNANVASAYILTSSTKGLPFYFCSLAAATWFIRAWHGKTVIASCSLITVATFLRGLEVLFFADRYTVQQRLTGVSLWWFISGTTLAFGVIGLIAVSRREVERWIDDMGT